MDAICIDQVITDSYAMYNGDCVDVVAALPDESIGFTVFSPPFASLYTYSSSERDMGNSASYDEFWQHFRYLIEHLHRVTMPGRLVSVHCMNLPLMKQRDGVIGVKDFRGDVIRQFEAVDWVFHSEVCVWKDPVVEMQRTKSLGLLHKQVVKDSCMSRQGMPDYVCTFRKRGENPSPVAGTLDHFAGEPFRQEGNLSIDIWQRYASPVWMDIRPNRTLQYTTARDEEDERHICPLQLDVIERCMQLWSNEGDTVLSPFAGIGSEGYVAVKMLRRFVGVELKESYFRIACRNLERADEECRKQVLF